MSIFLGTPPKKIFFQFFRTPAFNIYLTFSRITCYASMKSARRIHIEGGLKLPADEYRSCQKKNVYFLCILFC